MRSPLGSVMEEGMWHRADLNNGGRGRGRNQKLERQGSESTQDADTEDGDSVNSREQEKERDGSRSTSAASISRRGSRKGREGLKLHERGRLNMQGKQVVLHRYNHTRHLPSYFLTRSPDVVV